VIQRRRRGVERYLTAQPAQVPRTAI